MYFPTYISGCFEEYSIYISMENFDGTNLQGENIVGTLMSGASQTSSGVKGNALQLDRNQYVDFGNQSTNCLGDITKCTNTITIAMWFYFNGNLGKWSSVFFNNAYILIYLTKYHSGQYGINLYCMANYPLAFQYSVSTIPVNPDGWQHLTFSCSQNNVGHIGLNGQEIPDTDGDIVQSSTWSFATIDPLHQNMVWLGKSSTSDNEPFWVDELYIWYEYVNSSIIAACIDTNI